MSFPAAVPRQISSHNKDEIRKWDARGALLGHPGPSPPNEPTSSSILTASEDENPVSYDVQKEILESNDEDDEKHELDDFGEKVQILDREKKTGNVCYCVRAVIEEPFIEENRESHYLLIQESKPESKFKWYLPAGLVLRNESLEQAIIRVVLQEAGITVVPLTVLLIEEIGPFWLRFTFLMKIVNNNLKSVEDVFSIKAQYWSQEKINHKRRELRDEDMLRAIRVAIKVKYRQPDSRVQNYKWNALSIESKGKKYISIRACFTFHNEAEKSYWVIKHKKTKALPNLPGWPALDHKCLHAVVWKFLHRITELQDHHWYSYKTEGVTCIEHKKAETNNDLQGIRLTVVFRILLDEAKITNMTIINPPKVKSSSPYDWHEIQDVTAKHAIRDILNLNILTPLQSPKLIKLGHCLNAEYQSKIDLANYHSNPFFSTGYNRQRNGGAGGP